MQLKYKTKFNEFKKLMYRKLQDKNLKLKKKKKKHH